MFLVLKRRNVMIVLAVLILLQLGLTTYLCVSIFSKKQAAIVDFTIVIDAGHGGVDGGVVVDGVKESDLNLKYAKTLGKQLEICGFNVVYTRTDADGLYGRADSGFKLRDMQKRRDIILAACPNIVISIHMNKFSQSIRSGPQVFFQQGSADGAMLAENLQSVFNRFTGNNHEAIDGDFYICRESPCPAVIVECGFLSNAEESALLQTDSYRQELCDKIFQGIMLYLYSA